MNASTESIDPTAGDERLEAFVRKNVAYYREAWRPFRETTGPRPSFNLAALLLQVGWLLYRKLYLAAAIVMTVMVADVALVLYVEANALVAPGVLAAWNTVVALLLVGIPGFYGNYWYWRRFRHAEQAAVARYQEPVAQREYLRILGGTNPFAALAMVLLLLAPVLWGGFWALQYSEEGYVFDATGPLTLAEVEANFLSRLDQDISERQWACVRREVAERVQAAGDPETLDPTTVEFLPVEQWQDLDDFGKRLVLSQAITTKAFFECP